MVRGGSFTVMAYKKDDDTQVVLSSRDYHELINDHLTLRALRILECERCPKYKSIQSIMEDPRIETHIRPIKKH